MTNYTNMLRMNEKVCEEKRILAIDTIRRMVRDNEQITICELTKQTGLSRSFFYKNAVVNMELNAALKTQQGKILSSKRDKKLNEALKETVKLQKDEIEKLRMEKSRLTPNGSPALVNPINKGIDEQEQNGVTVPSKAAIQFADTPLNLPMIFLLLSGGK